MKWAWISVGVALIVAVTMICCCMIYVGSYAGSCFVWALYGLLVAYFIACGRLIMKNMKNASVRQKADLQQKENEYKRNLSETAVMKEILALQKRLDKLEDDVKKCRETINKIVL